MTTMRTTILILAILIAAGAAQAWEFSVGVCGADQFYARNPEADLYLVFDDLMGPLHIEIPLERPDLNGPVPIGPFGSYVRWWLLGIADDRQLTAYVLDATTDERYGTIGPIYSIHDGRLFNIRLAGDCSNAPAQPIRNEVHWQKPLPDNSAIKSGAVDTPSTWSSLKAGYR